MRQQPARGPDVIIRDLALGETAGKHDLLRPADLAKLILKIARAHGCRPSGTAPASYSENIHVRTSGLFRAEGEDLSMAEKLKRSKVIRSRAIGHFQRATVIRGNGRTRRQPARLFLRPARRDRAHLPSGRKHQAVSLRR